MMYVFPSLLSICCFFYFRGKTFPSNDLNTELLLTAVFQGTVTYYLILDNRFRASSGYLGAEFQETMVGLYCPF